MLNHLAGLAAVVDDGDRSRRSVWLTNIALAVLGDFGLVYYQILALQKQRAGEGYGREAAMYVLAIILCYAATRRLWTNRPGPRPRHASPHRPPAPRAPRPLRGPRPRRPQ